MYFPYLVVRSEEVQAIKATICNFEDNNVIPILEPYNKEESNFYYYKSLISAVKSLIDNRKKFILIINSENDLSRLKAHFPVLDNFCIHGYYSDNSNYSSVDANINIAIIHRNINNTIIDSNNIKYHIFLPCVLRFTSYINGFQKLKTVIIEDGFVKHQPNNTYPNVEYFNSELVFTYNSKGILGFGDFTILEYGYTPPGGAHADDITHVIHLTHKPKLENKLNTYHYLTTPSMEADNRTRSEKTIDKAYQNRNRFLQTKGIEKIIELYPNGTSLAMYKRIGMMHHIDLIHSLL